MSGDGKELKILVSVAGVGVAMYLLNRARQMKGAGSGIMGQNADYASEGKGPNFRNPEHQHTYTPDWNLPVIKVSPKKRTADAQGWRAKIGCCAPATNTIVQPDFDAMAFGLEGVTNHFGRITCSNSSLASEKAFEEFQVVMRFEMGYAIDRCMAAECDYMALGISAPTFYGGYQKCKENLEKCKLRCGVGVSSGSFSCEAALKKFGVKKISFFSPYGANGNLEVRRFFTEAGFTVLNDVYLGASCPIAIAEIPPEMIEKAFDDIDSPDCEALVQVGTNCSGTPLCEKMEKKFKKPVICINTATYWHALRSLGIDDKIKGFGRLLEEY